MLGLRSSLAYVGSKWSCFHKHQLTAYGQHKSAGKHDLTPPHRWILHLDLFIVSVSVAKSPVW